MLHCSMAHSCTYNFTEPELPADECQGGWSGLESPDCSADETGTSVGRGIAIQWNPSIVGTLLSVLYREVPSFQE